MNKTFSCRTTGERDREIDEIPLTEGSPYCMGIKGRHRRLISALSKHVAVRVEESERQRKREKTEEREREDSRNR